MTNKEFLYWLVGYLNGVIASGNGLVDYEIVDLLEKCQKQLNQIVEDRLLLDTEPYYNGRLFPEGTK